MAVMDKKQRTGGGHSSGTLDDVNTRLAARSEEAVRLRRAVHIEDEQASRSTLDQKCLYIADHFPGGAHIRADDHINNRFDAAFAIRKLEDQPANCIDEEGSVAPHIDNRHVTLAWNEYPLLTLWIPIWNLHSHLHTRLG